MGADATAHAIAAEAARRGLEIQLIRNGSRGLLWLEPMVELEVAGRRHAYGPVQPQDAASLLEALQGAGGEPRSTRSLTARPRKFPISSASSA
jgi:formate dehydrogenase iron-sulfur subunit